MAVVALPIVNQPDIEADAWDFWREIFSFLEVVEGLFPTLASHFDDAQVRICRAGTRIEGQDTLETSLRCIEVSFSKGCFAFGKDLLRVLVGSGRSRGRRCIRALLRRAGRS